MKNTGILMLLVLLTSCNAGKYYFNKRISSGSPEETYNTIKADPSFNEEENNYAMTQDQIENEKQTVDNTNEPETASGIEIAKKMVYQKDDSTECNSERTVVKFETITTKGSVKKYESEKKNENALDKSDLAKHETNNGDMLAAIIGIGIVLAVVLYAYSVLGSLLFMILGILLACLAGIFVVALIFGGLFWLAEEVGINEPEFLK